MLRGRHHHDLFHTIVSKNRLGGVGGTRNRVERVNYRSTALALQYEKVQNIVQSDDSLQMMRPIGRTLTDCWPMIVAYGG